MAHIVEDRILESTTSTGAVSVALAAPVTGFRRFSAVCAVGDTVPYFIEAVDAVGLPSGDYEYGIGTYSAANVLTRTKVLGSSNAGAAVNFAAGSKNVGIPAMGAGQMPVGSVFFFPAAAAPAGYVKLNGALLSRAQYPALYSFAVASGNMAANDGAWLPGQFSPGDGATTFRVPDARGEFLRGYDDGKGTDAGRTLGSLQTDAFQGHYHGTSGTSFLSPLPGGAGATTGGAGQFSAPVIQGPTTDGVNGAPRTAAETRPRNLALLVCIKT